jgi:hypothetical protein
MSFNPKEASEIVLASCSLHNFLEEVSESYALSWAEGQTFNDVESTEVAFAREPQPDDDNTAPGVYRRIQHVRSLGLGWDDPEMFET